MSTPTVNCTSSEKPFCNKFIYRYISFQRLADILKNKQNSLVDPSRWSDPFERWRINKIFDGNQKDEAAKYFGQCWTRGYMHDAMWSLYTKGTDGFRIKIKISDLIGDLGEQGVPCLIAKVLYLKRSEIESYFGVDNCMKTEPSKRNDIVCRINNHFKRYSCSGNMCESENIIEIAKKFMVKRRGFKHENEFRIICYKDNTDRYYRYDICLEKMISEIMVHPLVSDHDFQVLEWALDKVGYKGTVRLSKLHDMTVDN